LVPFFIAREWHHALWRPSPRGVSRLTSRPKRANLHSFFAAKEAAMADDKVQPPDPKTPLLEVDSSGQVSVFLSHLQKLGIKRVEQLVCLTDEVLAKMAIMLRLFRSGDGDPSVEGESSLMEEAKEFVRHLNEWADRRRIYLRGNSWKNEERVISTWMVNFFRNHDLRQMILASFFEDGEEGYAPILTFHIYPPKTFPFEVLKDAIEMDLAPMLKEENFLDGVVMRILVYNYVTKRLFELAVE
jgi:hypothetical protein